MSTSAPNKTALIERLQVSDETVRVDFNDGRSVSVPLAWFPRLLHGTAKERNTYRLIGRGEGAHWPLLDEDLSAKGLLSGRRSGESSASFARWLKARGAGSRRSRGKKAAVSAAS
jgi:hypothetical protein